jgi:hypothetical protein
MAPKNSRKTAAAEMANGNLNGFDTIKDYADVVALSKDNAEALFEAATATTSGLETIAGEVLAYSRQALQANITTARALFAAKSVEEFFQLQTAWAKNLSEGYVDQLTKIGSLVSNTAQDALGPLQSRAASFVKSS